MFIVHIFSNRRGTDAWSELMNTIELFWAPIFNVFRILPVFSFFSSKSKNPNENDQWKFQGVERHMPLSVNENMNYEIRRWIAQWLHIVNSFSSEWDWLLERPLFWFKRQQMQFSCIHWNRHSRSSMNDSECSPEMNNSKRLIPEQVPITIDVRCYQTGIPWRVSK